MTLHDERVRRAGQYHPGSLSLSGEGWRAAFASIVGAAATGLGLPATARAKLYKLLIYGPGDFFVSHRDTEKEPHMVGTLVVALPARWEGGDLVVRHAGRSRTLCLQTDGADELSWAAFYCDCEHELQPVTAGHRLVLVYNLVSDQPAQPPDHRPTVQTLASCLKRGGQALGKQVVLLDHHYTEAELCWSALKGADAARAQALAAAAQEAGWEIAVALLERWRSHAAWTSVWGHDHELELDDIEVEDEIDGHDRLSHLQGPTGPRPELGTLTFSDDQLLSGKGLPADRPDEFAYYEATGNEGATVDRTWRRAALVLWPGSSTPDVVAEAGWWSAEPYLLVAAGRHGKTGQPRTGTWASPRPTVQQAADVAERVLGRPDPSLLGEQAALVLAALVAGDRSDALRHWADDLAPTQQLRRGTLESAARALVRLPASSTHRLVAARADREPAVVSALLAALAELSGVDPAAQSRLVAGLEGLLACWSEAYQPPRRWDPEPPNPWDISPREDALIDLAFVLQEVPSELREAAWSAILTDPARWPLRAALASAALELGEEEPALLKLALAGLRQATAVTPTPPEDHARSGAIDCSCGDCAEINAFLPRPDQAQLRLPIAKPRRKHIYQKIRYSNLDLEAKTERKGRPYTLVVTKTARAFERLRECYEIDCEVLQELEGEGGEE